MINNPEYLLERTKRNTGMTFHKAAIYCVLILPLTCLTFLFSFTGCKDENSPPTASLSVSPTSGDVPLVANINLTGTDPDGDNDIKTYRLNVNGEVTTSSTPISITKTFDKEGNVTISGEIIDSKNAKDTDIKSVTVSTGPFIDQSVNLVNIVELSYTATLSKVSKAVLTISKDGSLFLTKDIPDVVSNGVDFSKVFNYATDKLVKGNYEFILKSDNFEKKINIVVPNYLPDINLTGLNFNLVEDSRRKILIKNIYDKNPEDNSHLIGVKSFDNKTQMSLSGDTVIITSLKNPLGNYKTPFFLGAYQGELEFGSTTGGIAKTIFNGNITLDPRPKVEPFTAPNDSTLNWYGSGDVNKDNKVTIEDLNMLKAILDKTYTNPNDIRLMDRANVTGSGTVSIDDYVLLEKKLNSTLPHLPGEWNKLTTQSEREDWIRKIFVIGKTYLLIFPGAGPACAHYNNQAMIDFRGVSQSDLEKYLSIYPYETKNNGRFNIPLLDILITDYDASGRVIGGHAMSSVITGDNAYVWNDLFNLEVQRINGLDVQPGQFYFIGVNTEFDIRGPSISLGNKVVEMQGYAVYIVKAFTPTLYLQPNSSTPWQNSNLKFINERIK